MTPPRWKVYYDGGSAFSDADGGPELAPALGVLVVAFADRDTGRYLLSRHDFYWFDAGRWWGGDHFGLWDYLTRPGWKRVLFGRVVAGETWNAAMLAAEADPELPAKTTRDVREGWAP